LAGEEFGKVAEGFSGKVSAEQLRGAKEAVKAIQVDPAIVSLIQKFVAATRPGNEHFPESFAKKVSFGSGPRGGIAWISAGRAIAMMSGDPSLRWSHLERILLPTLRHRIGFRSFGTNLEEEKEFFAAIKEQVQKATSSDVWG
jgi:MoxR-like ATPase